MKKRDRLIIVLLVLFLCGLFLYPTFKWYVLTPSETKDLASGSNEQIREYALGQATKDLHEIKNLVQSDENAEVPAKFIYLEAIAKDNYHAMKKDVPSKWNILNLCAGFYTEKDIFNTLENHYRSSIYDAKTLSNNVLQLGLDLRGGMSILLDADKDAYEKKVGKAVSDTEVTKLVNQDIEILKNRIDQFGVSEPEIRLQGSNQILVEIPGAADPERVNSFLQGKGSLVFQIVDTTLTDKINTEYAANPGEAYTEDGQIKQPADLPAGKTVAGYYVKDDYGIDELKKFVVLDDEIGLDGIHLESSTTSTNGITGQPVVDFHLDSVGGDQFYKLTSTHVGDSMAVVMDGKVKSVATINEAIRQDVQISGFSKNEASDLAVVLRTAALPIELTVSSQQSVGATLGEDAVSAGLRAIAIGLLLVVVFMVLYYSLCGLVADLALVFNLVIMLACLSAFHFTLTLTSIAGLILTLGMAVDANVIIYERIKEELAVGKSSQAAVRQGFSKAFWTIMDANITTIIAALVLSQLGSSAVKGFANTLAIGIISSLFTALFVSHLIFDTTITDKEGAKIHIGRRAKK
ncbi:MAG: protein translocase subunit SecD [Spirochaetia bacterium]|jgi:preprotein translocase subunit SecD|nr:protein translocase subunit SecD [Spirochaetia bacterium]